MSDDHLAVLTQDVRRFLKETNYDNCEVFLATPSKDIAQKYIKWRVENNKPALRQDPVNVVYAWKQEVTRKQRDSKASAGSKAQAVLHVQSVGVPKSSPPPVKMVVTNKSPPPPPRPSRLSRRHKPINPKTAPGPDHAKEVRQRFGAPQMVKVPGVNDGT